MGRELIAVARWKGEVAEVKVLLEAREIILRGAIKARIARSQVTEATTNGDKLSLLVDGEFLVLELGAKSAKTWLDALLKPPPSLASKLGIGTENAAFVVGSSDDANLDEALSGATSRRLKDAKIIIAILEDERDLPRVLAAARERPNLFLWCVHAKGKNASISDATIRSFMRGNGYVDSKSCAVSERLTATRYGPKA